jgi:PTH1 family peptidyl-tRNA hydrolase
MTYIIAGLGNPGPEYEGTRHNTGRIVLEIFRKKQEFPDWETDKKLRALVSRGKLKKQEVLLLEPETFMNNSGGPTSQMLRRVSSGKKAAENLVVIHDDLDLAIGTFKISFNRGSGGHKGVENIIKAIGTEGFVRVRVGISPATPSGKLKKPSGEKEVGDFILSDFKPKETELLKKTGKRIAEALEVLVLDGRDMAMNRFN